MNGHDAGQGRGVAALLPQYTLSRALVAAVLLIALGVAWGLEDSIVAWFGGGDEIFAEDFQGYRELATAAAGTLLLVLVVGEELLIALLLAAMTMVTFTQVVLRYGFNSGLLWGLEGSGYLFAWLVLIGMSYGIRVSAHIGIDMVVKAMPRGLHRLVGAIAVGLSLVYVWIMVEGSYFYIERLHRLEVMADDIPLERWLLGMVLPVGFVLLGYRLLEILFGIINGTRDGFDLPDEAREIIKESGLVGDGGTDGVGAAGTPVGGGRP